MSRSPDHPFAWLVFLSAVLSALAVSPGVLEAQGRRANSQAERKALADLTKKLLGQIESSRSISRAIDTYNDVERKRRFDVGGRYRLHRALLNALREVEDPVLKRTAVRVLKSPSKSKFAG